MSYPKREEWWKSKDPNLPALSEALKAAQTPPPGCTGVIPATSSETSLFFTGPTGLGLLRFDSPSAETLDQLSNSCAPATFGRDGDDVLDDNYRKAGRLDIGNFAWSFQPENSAIRAEISSKLLSEKQAERGIRFELYKLNVYGKGSFFKVHKDTPRGGKMFGSLVIVLSAPHEGGNLVLRHHDKELVVDAASMLRNTDTPSITYAAFFSDVDHEVEEVTAGHRITITYNLHFIYDNPKNKANEDSCNIAPSLGAGGSAFELNLAQLLDDPEFLPTGGLLGFGLTHEYQVNKNNRDPNFPRILKSLKGGDALLSDALSRLGLKFDLRLIYQESDSREADFADWAIMTSKIWHTDEDQIENAKTALLEDDPASRLIYETDYYNEGEVKEESKVLWVTPPSSSRTFVELPYIAYGNEASLAYSYADFSLIAIIGRPGKRISQGII